MNLGKKEYIAIYHIKEIIVFTNDMKQKNKQTNKKNKKKTKKN